VHGRDLPDLVKEAVKFGNSVDAFLGIQDKSQVFLITKRLMKNLVHTIFYQRKDNQIR
jgi:hypothetical protein